MTPIAETFLYGTETGKCTFGGGPIR